MAVTKWEAEVLVVDAKYSEDVLARLSLCVVWGLSYGTNSKE